jgi:hypothetical protein
MIQFASSAKVIEKNLDINFVVRTIHASRVINEISQGNATMFAKFNPGKLSKTEIAALPNNATSELITAYPQYIVTFVSHLRVGFTACFNICPDTSVPYEINRTLQ